MLSLFKKRAEEKSIKSMFQDLVAPEIVNEILKQRDGGMPDLGFTEERQIEFMVVCVGGETPAEICARVGKVVDLTLSSGCLFGCIGPIVVLTVGKGSPIPCEGDRLRLIARLQSELGNGIKIVHGAAKGRFGIVGSERSFGSFTFLIPQFDRVLGALSELKFGEVREIEFGK